MRCLPFASLVHWFFSVEHKARRKSAPSRANHALQRTSQWSGVEVRHPARDGMRHCPVLADWTSHVFVHEHPRNCSYMRTCKTDAHSLADNCGHGTKHPPSRRASLRTPLRRRTPQSCIFFPDSASNLLLHGHENKVPSESWQRAHAAHLRLSCSATASLTPEFQLHVI